ncbi:MAG: hypothetical protein QXE05_12460 [Nitrososphaeria archaeon]
MLEEANQTPNESHPELTERLIQFILAWFPNYFEKTFGMKITEEKIKELRGYLKKYVYKILEATKSLLNGLQEVSVRHLKSSVSRYLKSLINIQETTAKGIFLSLNSTRISTKEFFSKA